MKDVSHITHIFEQEDSSQQRSKSTIRFPLWLKAVFVLVLTLLPLLIGLSVASFLWWSPGDFSSIMRQVLAEQLPVFHYAIRLYYLLLATLTLLGFYLGYLSFKYFFIDPIHALLLWLQQARSAQFAQVPLLPHLHHDDIGELGRALSSSVAYFSETKGENSVLMEEKTLFMTIAAHQLRTPLTGLLWSIEGLLNPQSSPDDKQKFLTDVDGLLKRMRLIINHILASANVEGGRFGYVFEKVDIAAIIEKLIEEFKPVSGSHGVTIGFEHSEGLFPVYADTERITLALFDLISNAVDYTPKGGTITISVTPEGQRLEIAITDTGIGISETEIPSLFTKFYRSDRARHMRPDGSGLGLFLVKNIISSHGSDITVTSKEGSGSRFSFFLDSQKKP